VCISVSLSLCVCIFSHSLSHSSLSLTHTHSLSLNNSTSVSAADFLCTTNSSLVRDRTSQFLPTNAASQRKGISRGKGEWGLTKKRKEVGSVVCE